MIFLTFWLVILTMRHFKLAKYVEDNKTILFELIENTNTFVKTLKDFKREFKQNLTNIKKDMVEAMKIIKLLKGKN